MKSLRRFLPALLCLLAMTSARADLLVSSFSGNRVLRYNETNGAFVSIFIAANSGGLNLPHGLAEGPDGNLYLASAGNAAVLRFNGTNGAFIDTFIASGSGGLDYPVWLEFRADGFLYVSSQLNNSVLRYNATNGAFVGAFVTNGSGGLNGPSGMTWGNDGHLYVVGRFGNQLLKYDGTNGAFLGVLGTSPNLAQPFGVAVGPDGSLHVVNGNSNNVVRFDGQTGNYLGVFAPGAGSSSAGMSSPIGLGFGPDGSLYVASFNSNLLSRYSGASGLFQSTFVAPTSGGLSGPNFFLFRPARTYGTNIAGLGPIGPIEQRHITRLFTEGPAADANGHLYFSDVQGNTIYRSDTRGLLSAFFTNSSACNGLMFDQRGRLLACQRDQRRIIAIDPITRAVTPLATNWNSRAFIGPNDLVVDSAGGIYFTDPNFNGTQTGPTQSVYYVTAAGVVSQIISNLSRPNGVILSPDETKLYVVLSGTSTFYTHPVLAPGVIGAPTTITLPSPGDGMTIDTQGNLYLCQTTGNRILVLSPAGATLGFIPCPESPANCTFGGKDMKTLFITARTSLYACRMSSTGHRFAWNPSTYADYQIKFFGTTTAPNSALADDPDGDAANNELEFLNHTHPLCAGDQWRLTLQRSGTEVLLSFPYWSDRSYQVLTKSSLDAPSVWQPLAGWIPPAPSPLRQTAVVTRALSPLTNEFFRVQFSPTSP